MAEESNFFELIFITSSADKLVHAEHLCRNYAIVISKQKNYGRGYVEPRIDNRETLLKESVKDAIIRFEKYTPNAKNRFFIIEDTSVIIEALSEEKEYPGVDIKFWMKENSFEKVDEELKEKGNNRAVIVRSDVVLVLSDHLENKLGVKYKIFTSQVKGIITPKEFDVKTQPLYSWLNKKTFNKWFIPNGCEKPMSLLNIEQADENDFRAGAFNEMLDFLHYHKVISLRKDVYKVSQQTNLFKPTLFIICGQTCAGKTTLATYLGEQYGYYHIEASDFMYLSYYQRHKLNSGIAIGDFAEDALKNNPNIVADQIINHLSNKETLPIVITGLRNPKEIERLEKEYGQKFIIKLIYIDASQELRFKRSLIRNRLDGEVKIEDFEEKDKQQISMGLPAIKEKSNEVIVNESTIEGFTRKFEDLFYQELEIVKQNSINKINRKVVSKRNLQNAIIQALGSQTDQSKFYTTTEIAYLINNSLQIPKNKNNVSRFFNQDYHPYFEISVNENNIAVYKLSQTGYSLFKLLLRLE